jgi:3-deoxy-D-manno-octulosonic-acid transferase
MGLTSRNRYDSMVTMPLCCPVQVIVQDVPLDSYISMGRFLAHFQPQACILMVRRTQRGQHGSA